MLKIGMYKRLRPKMLKVNNLRNKLTRELKKLLICVITKYIYGLRMYFFTKVTII
jgi:hypothetical protein